jgi:hypothetical protein
MNLTPIPPIVVGAAGAPLAQTKGSELDRATQESAAQQRQVQGEVKAEMAAGIGTTEEDSGASADRDADGRRPWEAAAQSPDKQQQADPTASGPRVSRDASGQCGRQLDLSG